MILIREIGSRLINSYYPSGKQKHKLFILCKCEQCGKEVETRKEGFNRIKNRPCQSCSSINNNTTHGHSATKLYHVWSAIKKRCYIKTCKSYSTYGARGIGMCEEWRNSFELFMEFAYSNGYKEGLDIDRVNNDGNYEPSNCQFISPSENRKKDKSMFSTEDAIFILNDRKELSMTIKEYAKHKSISYSTICKYEKIAKEVLNILKKTYSD